MLKQAVLSGLGRLKTSKHTNHMKLGEKSGGGGLEERGGFVLNQTIFNIHLWISQTIKRGKCISYGNTSSFQPYEAAQAQAGDSSEDCVTMK